ncbi:MAG: LysR family transcriptional regulator [Pseudomonadota bacterium]|nr:LysR family transcriptional regulator [Pseudomonadota bacterium]
MDRQTSRHYYKHNRLQQLRGFCHAAQTGSISKAAERMFLSQPSVSLQIQALERELEVVLFERRGPKIKLTPEGQILYELALPLVEGLETLPENFAARRGSLESGQLNIAAGESTLLYLLPEIVGRFATQYPGIHFNLHNVTGRDGMEMLRADEVDFAVGSMLDVPEDITYWPIYSYDPMLITSLDHPLVRLNEVTLEEISRYGLILPPRHLSTWRVVRMVFQQHNLDFKVTLEAGGWEVIKKYVALGFGISIVTSICLTGREKLHTIALDKYFPKRTYGVVIRKGKFLTPAAKRFIELMDPQFFQRMEASHINGDSAAVE